MGAEPKYPSQLAERFQVRMPDGLRDRLRDAAEINGRSMNAEIVHRLEASFSEDQQVERLMQSERALLSVVADLRNSRNALEEQIRHLVKLVEERAAPSQDGGRDDLR